MKYCEYCGKAISDNAAFCSGCGKSCQSVAPVRTFCENCGRPLEADQRFCQGCGKPVGSVPIPVLPVQPDPAAQFVLQPAPRTVPQSMPQPMPQPIPQPMPQPASQPVYPVPVQPVQPEYNTPAPVTAKKRKMPKWVLAVTAVVLVAAIGLGIFALCGGFIKRAEFPTMSVSEDSIQDFLNVVIENAKGDYASYVFDLHFIYVTEPGLSRDYVLSSESTVQIHIRDWINGSLKLNPGFVSISTRAQGSVFENKSSMYSQKQYESARDIIIALEKTVAGKSQADTYLKSYAEMQKQARAWIESEEWIDGTTNNKELGTYRLSDDIEVTITLGCSAAVWSVSYQIKFYA